MPSPSREEKLSRIAATFKGGFKTKRGRSVDSGQSPILFGVAVRALARKSQGYELSRLEQNAAGMWSSLVADEDEMAEYAKLYSNQDIAQTLPSSLTELPLEQPYTWEDYTRDAAAQPASRTVESPALQIVDLATASFNNGEDAEPTTNVGGATFYTSSKPSSASRSAGINSSVDGERSLYMNLFECMRKQTDNVSGGKNEIYWMYSAADYKAPKEHGKTETFGEVVKGDVRHFWNWQAILPPQPGVPFNGRNLYTGRIGPGTVIAVHLECWEQDDSTAAWAEKLKKAMSNVSEMLLDAAVEATSIDEGKEAAAVLAILAGITGFIAGLIDWLRNDDDLVRERSLMFDYAALQALWNKAGHTDWWEFNGGEEGWHRLWLGLR